MKKVLSLVLALVMALSLCTSAWATSEETGESTGATVGTETGGTGANGTGGGETGGESGSEGTSGETGTTYVAQIGETTYETLAAAIKAAKSGATVTLQADTHENVTISTNNLTLDLNGFTLNGGTEKGKPALTVTARGVTVKDSSEGKTGTIMREDTAENSGVSSHYVIDVQGNGWLTFESGTVKKAAVQAVQRARPLSASATTALKSSPVWSSMAARSPRTISLSSRLPAAT